MKKIIFSILCLTAAYADEPNNILIVDPYLSPYIGAEDLLTAIRVVEKTVDSIPLSPQLNNWATRLAGQIFIWDPLGVTAAVVQHEFFGHGYRFRTVHAFNRKYSIVPPFPYGKLGGYARASLDPETTTAFDLLDIYSGGVEGNAILANRLKLHWLQNGNVDPRTSVLYIFAEQDLTRYTLITKPSGLGGGDIAAYLRTLNDLYPHDKLSVKSLRAQSLVNLADPFTYYAAYSWLYYVFNGRQQAAPMIPIGSYGYLPGLRLGLTPFGPEYYLENFLLDDKTPIYFYLRYGKHGGHSYTGFGIEHPTLLWQSPSASIGLRLDAWYQPHTAFNDKNFNLYSLSQLPKAPYHPRPGISASLIAQQKFSDRGSYFLQLGGKTKGFLEGEPLKQSAIARAGITLRF